MKNRPSDNFNNNMLYRDGENRTYHVQTSLSKLTLQNCLLIFYIHCHMELLAKFPASKDENDLYS